MQSTNTDTCGAPVRYTHAALCALQIACPQVKIKAASNTWGWAVFPSASAAQVRSLLLKFTCCTSTKVQILTPEELLFLQACHALQPSQQLKILRIEEATRHELAMAGLALFSLH